LERIELAKVNATKEAMAKESTKTIKGLSSTTHPIDGKATANVRRL
jgi:hypothetical protein